MENTANTKDRGYTVARAAGSDTGHIVAVTGDYYGAYAPAAVCGTSPRIRYSSTRWFATDDTYPTPAAAAAARPGAMCKRCTAAAAKIAAATPAAEVSAPAESLEENTMSHPLIEASKAAATRRLQHQFSMSYPALDGGVVMQGHADYCRDHGHATHTVDGVVSEHCPRCGDRLTPAAPVEVEAPEYSNGERALGLEAMIQAGRVSEHDAPALEDVPVDVLEAVKAAKVATGISNLNYGWTRVFDATVDALKAPASPADIHPRAVELAMMAAPGSTRVDLDPATAPTAAYRTARATVTAYFQGGPGRGECVDAVILTVTGGDSHPARMFAASDALTALQGRVSGNITAGEYQTLADADTDTTLFIYGTWNND